MYFFNYLGAETPIYATSHKSHANNPTNSNQLMPNAFSTTSTLLHSTASPTTPSVGGVPRFSSGRTQHRSTGSSTNGLPFSGSGSSGSNTNQSERKDPPKQPSNPFEQDMMMLHDGEDQEMDAMDSRTASMLFFHNGKL